MVRVGDCRQVLGDLPDGFVDAVVTDPPYELGFMGKSWDSSGVAYDVGLWCEVLRVLKPGGHVLAFGGSRTYHRLACAVEDAGFEIRDQIMWVYGSGFPKSLNVSKSIEGLLTTGNAQKNGFHKLSGEALGGGSIGMYDDVEEQGFRKRQPKQHGARSLDATTLEAKRWDGWGTALKPAHEPIVVARKPLDGTVAANVLKHGVGALNIDGCRVGRADGDVSHAGHRTATFGTQTTVSGGDGSGGWEQSAGRWPANFIHDGSDEVTELFPDSNGGAFPKKANVPTGQRYEGGWGAVDNGIRTEMGSGSAARFFYCAKAGKKERNAGLDDFEPKREADRTKDDGNGGNNPRNRSNTPKQNHHPTVKPITLMRYLCRLITPPNGLILDPFTGSGTTGIAAIEEGFQFMGIEQDAEYAKIAEARIRHAYDSR